MNGSVRRAIAGRAPHRIPSGTPTSDDTTKPQKIDGDAVPQRLVQPRLVRAGRRRREARHERARHLVRRGQEDRVRARARRRGGRRARWMRAFSAIASPSTQLAGREPGGVARRPSTRSIGCQTNGT